MIFGIVPQVLHPTATLFILPATAPTAMAVLIFMFLLKMKRAIGKKPSTLDHPSIQRETTKHHSSMPIIRVYIFRAMGAPDSVAQIFMYQEKKLMATGPHPLILDILSILMTMKVVLLLQAMVPLRISLVIDPIVEANWIFIKSL